MPCYYMIMLLWTWECRYRFKILISFLWIYTQREIAGSYGSFQTEDDAVWIYLGLENSSRKSMEERAHSRGSRVWGRSVRCGGWGSGGGGEDSGHSWSVTVLRTPRTEKDGLPDLQLSLYHPGWYAAWSSGWPHPVCNLQHCVITLPKINPWRRTWSCSQWEGFLKWGTWEGISFFAKKIKSNVKIRDSLKQPCFFVSRISKA